MKKYNHDELVKKARHWLWTQGCGLVITEMSSTTQEPDAIGWHPGYSILIECKANRSDFLNDRHKPHMRSGESMGDKRYYLAPFGVIYRNELPAKWGLIEPYGNGLTIIESGAFFLEKDWRSEMHLLVSAIRRMDCERAKGVSVRLYHYETGKRATLGILKEKG